LRNALLWATPVILLVLGGAFMIVQARSRRLPGASALTDAEKSELDALLRRD
jgi:cytochrome c-type biogenesis protein CcmH